MRADREANTLNERLAVLERQAERAQIPGTSAVYFNQAGDMCLTAGDMARALDYFGLAIDAHIKADRFVAAAALCKKVLRVQPDVVRARCTLAWLSIGNGFEGDACTWVDTYVGAAERAGREQLAVRQLRRMAELAAGEELRAVVGEQLLALGDDRTANQVLGIAYGTRNGIKRLSQSNAEERWNGARHAALLSPRDLPV